MKLLVYLTLLFTLCSGCTHRYSKSKYQPAIQGLNSVHNMPYFPELSGDTVFWNLTKYQLDIIPSLIDGIVDTTKTMANVPNFGGVYRIGDACIVAIAEIIRDFKVIELIESDPNVLRQKGYFVYWEFVRNRFENRVELQRRVRLWFKENRQYLVWVKDDQLYSTTDDENGEQRKLPSGGYYIVKR